MTPEFISRRVCTMPSEQPASAESASPPTGGNRRRHPGRSPALVVSVSFVAGILVDSVVGIHWFRWLSATLVLAVTTGALLRIGRNRSTTVAVLALWFCLGGARHHQFWSVRPASEVSLIEVIDGRPVSLTARIATRPSIRPRSRRAADEVQSRTELTTCLLECRSIVTSAGRCRISGLVRLSVTGHLAGRTVGDTVHVHGRIFLPAKPRNPGEFDSASYLRRKGALCMMHTNHPDAVGLVRSAARWRPGRLIGEVRQQAEYVLARYLDDDALPTALALLLGNRDLMTDDVRNSFARSGTMHLLAISGLHVGILAGCLLAVCRVLAVPRRGTLLTVVSGIAAYTLITDARPSVVRATILITVALFSRSWHRTTSFVNTLAVAVLLILLWNPSDLFDTGAQLSFLAVAAIGWIRSASDPRPLPDPLVTDIRERILSSGLRLTLRSYGVMAAIALFTCPLIAHSFNLVSPVGLLINVLLIPVVAIILWSGYALLLAGFFTPWFAPILGSIFTAGHGAVSCLVDACAALRLGHIYIPTLPAWWLNGYYVFLAAGIVLAPGRARVLRPLNVVLAWTATGLMVALLPDGNRGLRCTFLDVGHGCSALIRTPAGRNLLVDAGSLSAGSRAQRAVQSTLWSYGEARIDVAIITHADADHFNGIARLLETVPTGVILVADTFPDVTQPGVRQVLDAATRHAVRINTIGAEDQIEIDPAVHIHVLHPPRNLSREADDPETDNELCIVLLIEFANRSVLLTGDIEGRGLHRLLATPPRKADIMLAAHHGSPAANTPALATWAAPDRIVVSADHVDSEPVLQQRYGAWACVLSTARHGAITFEVSSDGVIAETRHCENQNDAM